MQNKGSSSGGMNTSRVAVAAGLIIPPSRFKSYFMDRKAGKHARILFTGAVEHSLRTLLFDMKTVMSDQKRSVATPETVRLAVNSNRELAWSLGPHFISQSGWPQTHQFGVGKMRVAKKKTTATSK